MRMNEYQEKARETAIYKRKEGEITFYPYLGLGGEVGEVLEEVKKAERDEGGSITKERKERIVKELGDVLWYVTAIATDLEISLEDIASINIEKLQKRLENNTLRGSGSDR